MDNIEILKEVQTEIDRFSKKLKIAIKEQSVKDQYARKHYAAAKRGALDLKKELTKLTQDCKYKYDSSFYGQYDV